MLSGLHKKQGLMKPNYLMDRKKILSFNQKDYDMTFNTVKSIKVKTRSGKSYIAKFVGSHRTLGICILKIQAGKLAYLDLGKSIAEGEPADACAVLGIAEGEFNYTFNTGMISANRRNRGQHLQFDASINFGNSGGPVINNKGQLLGVALDPMRPNPIMGRMFSEEQMLKWQIAPNSGASFAARTSEIVKYLPRLKNGEHIDTYSGPYMGLAPAQNSLLDKRVVISVVAKNSPAEKAGFKKGDIIVSFNKKNITSWKTLITELDTLAVGQTIDIKVKRHKPRIEINGQTITDEKALKSMFKYLKDGQSFTGRYYEYEELTLPITLGERK